jgi:PKD repeat protein
MRFFYPLPLLLAFSVQLNAQLTADFTVNHVSGCAPLSVTFSDASTGGPTSWSWDFGNGNTSTLQNPSATYATPGTYTVSLTVSNGGGSNTLTRNAYITVFAKPTAYLTAASPPAGCLPLSVNFQDSSVQGDGVINTWLWDFGDGATGNAQDPTHSYTLAGTYTVSLTVTDANGCSASVLRNNYVTVAANGPTADFTGSPLTACAAPLNVTFTNNSSGGTAPLSYAWDFGDGNTSGGTSPSNSYATTGSYTVKLVVTDAGNCKDSLVRNNYVVLDSMCGCQY